MAINPIEVNGMVVRQQDFQSFKAQEEAKPLQDNINYQTQVEKNVETKSTNVVQKNDVDYNQNSDSRHNEYSGDGGKNRKKKEEDGKVINKTIRSFDVKI